MNFKELKRVFVVAEIGVNHEGKFGVALDMIKKAAECGADAVKFQTYKADKYISTVQPERLERARRFQLSYDEFRKLADAARDAGVMFISTPLHEGDVDFLDELVPLFKISSGDLTHNELITHVASKNKPVILSTGLGTREEITRAIDSVLNVQPGAATDGNLMLLHCVAAYPTEKADANLANVSWLQDQFGLPVGYSDHTLGIKACELAVARGAVLVEKHFTYRKTDQGFHDHGISADPDDMRQLVEAVRNVEMYMGKRERSLSESELKMLKHLRRSIAAAVDIPAGAPIQRGWLTYLRPAWGMAVNKLDRVVGKRLSRSVMAGDLIRQEDME